MCSDDYEISLVIGCVNLLVIEYVNGLYTKQPWQIVQLINKLSYL